MSSVTLAAAVPYPGKATRISHKGKKTQKNKGVSKYYPLYLIYWGILIIIFLHNTYLWHQFHTGPTLLNQTAAFLS